MRQQQVILNKSNQHAYANISSNEQRSIQDASANSTAVAQAKQHAVRQEAKLGEAKIDASANSGAASVNDVTTLLDADRAKLNASDTSKERHTIRRAELDTVVSEECRIIHAVHCNKADVIVSNSTSAADAAVECTAASSEKLCIDQRVEPEAATNPCPVGRSRCALVLNSHVPFSTAHHFSRVTHVGKRGNSVGPIFYARLS